MTRRGISWVLFALEMDQTTEFGWLRRRDWTTRAMPGDRRLACSGLTFSVVVVCRLVPAC